MNERPVILITGSSGGIGTAAAICCAKQGAQIVLHYHRNKKGAEDLAKTLDGADHICIAADLTNPEQTENLITETVSKAGKLDVVVNNAGVSRRADIANIDYEEWQKNWQYVVETNLTGPANLAYCASQAMLKQGGGRIVNVSSRGAFRGEPLMPWYGASKAGLNAMGQSMAQALGPENIYIYTVAPGFVETPMAAAILASPEGESIRNQSSMKRVAQPAEIAETIRYLAFDAPAFMTGCIIDVNGASYLRS